MAGSSSSERMVPLDPEYIQFLLDPDLGFSCYFVIGSAEHAPVEKIGVVKKMLAAHSSVFRAQLMNQQWKSKEPEEIVDILPATFKNLLRYIYGWDTTATMSFEDADDLLYAADRYIMNKLKDKLVTRLMSLLDYTNVCSLLTNPACATVLQLHTEITKILQYQTDKVLSTPQFLSCCTDTFVKILEQEVMNITELEVWKAALAWAKKRAESEDAGCLRQKLNGPLQHIRICSLSPEDFTKEVISTGVLNEEEINTVRLVHKSTEKPPAQMQHPNLNLNVKKRTGFEARPLSFEYQEFDEEDNVEEHFALNVYDVVDYDLKKQEHSFTLKLLYYGMEITGLHCGYCSQRQNFTVRIVPVEFSATETTFVIQAVSKPLREVYLPISTQERPVLLTPRKSYVVSISSDREFSVVSLESPEASHDHFTLEFPLLAGFKGVYGSPITCIRYKTLYAV